jgi:hypothetical protein
MVDSLHRRERHNELPDAAIGLDVREEEHAQNHEAVD